MKKHFVNYNDFQRIAMYLYNCGGDVLVECWGESEFKTYEEMFGKITARKVFVMCNDYREQEIDEKGYCY